MGEREIAEYVAACEAKGCCPLGAACRGLDPTRTIADFPWEEVAAERLSIGEAKATEIALGWGTRYGGGYDKAEAVAVALAAGLGPAMRRFLFGEERADGR